MSRTSLDSSEATFQAKGYQIIRKLGEGAYANVYLAEYRRDKTQKSLLACKVVDTKKAPKEFVTKFLPRELNILVKLNHPYIIHVHSIFMRAAKYYIFMRFAENGDLLDYITSKGPVIEAQARIWFRQMALALQYLHNMDIAHRDLKCENSLITANFNIKIADLGFARYVSDDGGQLLKSSTYCGSLTYAAPEILNGTPYFPKIADIWSLGIVLYVMLNKALPFEESNARRLRESQLKKRWRFRSTVANKLSNNVKRLVSLLLEPEVDKRCQIDKILKCDWILMDQRLVDLNEEERAAKEQVLDKNAALAIGTSRKAPDDITVLKEASKTVVKESETLVPTVSEKKN